MMDVIVIGAGIAGASCAYHLAAAGARVTVIDRRHRGEATGAAAGIVSPWLTQRRNRAWYRLVREGARYYPILLEKLAEDGEPNPGYQRVGTVYLHKPDKLNELEVLAKKRKKQSPEMGEITRLSAKETKRAFPSLRGGKSALYIDGGGRINGAALREALLRAAVRRGATWARGDARLLLKHGRVIGVKAGEKTYTADRVVAACGVWLPQLLLPLGIRFTVRRQKAEIIHVRLENAETGNWPVVMLPYGQYLLPFPKGRVVLGATHENSFLNTSVTAGGIHDILSKTLAEAPGLNQASFVAAKTGFRPFTPGYVPVVGRIPPFEELYVINGLGSSGLTSGPYLGFQLAQMVCGKSFEIDLTDYDVSAALED